MIGDLKQMSPKWIKGVSFVGYGVSLNVGIGIPIPVLNQEILKYAAIKDEEIIAAIIDYSDVYPNGKSDVLGEVNYQQLKSGAIEIKGKQVPTSGISSYRSALLIANELKEQIRTGKFLLTEKVADLPVGDATPKFKPLKERPIKEVK